jgi:hypothetical protein
VRAHGQVLSALQLRLVAVGEHLEARFRSWRCHTGTWQQEDAGGQRGKRRAGEQDCPWPAGEEEAPRARLGAGQRVRSRCVVADWPGGVFSPRP